MDRWDIGPVARYKDWLQGLSFPDGPVAGAGELYHSHILPHAPAGLEFRGFQPVWSHPRRAFSALVYLNLDSFATTLSGRLVLQLPRIMAESDSKESLAVPASPLEPVEPSWKPLLWLIGGLVVLIGLGELLIDVLLDMAETLFLVLVEAPEEILEDQIEDWLKVHVPHDADVYSERIAFYGLTPIKILTGVILARWLWRHSHSNLFPKFRAYLYRQYTAVRLAWQALAWYYKILTGMAVLGVLAILI
jgi:hypothetical protein